MLLYVRTGHTQRQRRRNSCCVSSHYAHGQTASLIPSDKPLSREKSETTMLKKWIQMSGCVNNREVYLSHSSVVFLTSYPQSEPPASSLWLLTSIFCFAPTRPGFKVLVNVFRLFLFFRSPFWSKSSVWNILQPSVSPILYWFIVKAGRTPVDWCSLDLSYRDCKDTFWMKVINHFWHLKLKKLHKHNDCLWSTFL